MQRRTHGRARFRVEALECRTVPSVFTPAQIRQAYGVDQVTFNGGAVAGDGSGQTIAIVDAYDDPTIAADLAHFDAQFGLAAPPSFVKATPQGQPAYNSGWAGEIALDVEWAHAIAPGANILLVEARSSSFADLLAAVDYARSQPGVSAVSMSWGASEFSSETSNDSHFITPAGHAGVTFLASSGDSGTPPEWPSVSTNVVSVGGTSLKLNADNSYAGETGWRSGGGGVSKYVTKPTYQTYVSTPSSTKRTSPDVAYDADPNTGVYVYDSSNGGAWYQYGGTSASSPQWAALIAVADQGRVLARLSSLDGPTETLFALYTMGQAQTTYFHDITSGSNGGGSRAGVGYDTVTGLGSPKAVQVVSALVGWVGTGTGGGFASGGATAPPGSGGPHALPVSVVEDGPAVFVAPPAAAPAAEAAPTGTTAAVAPRGETLSVAPPDEAPRPADPASVAVTVGIVAGTAPDVWGRGTDLDGLWTIAVD